MPGNREHEEDILGPPKPYAIQDSFIAPSFGLLVQAPELKNEFQFDQRFVEKEKEKGVRISISQLEQVIPWLQATEDGRKYERPQYGDKGIEGLVTGKRLHEADSLFSAVFNRLVGSEIRIALPSYSKEKLDPYYQASYDAYVGRDAGLDELESTLIRVWKRYHGSRNFDLNDKDIGAVLISGFGLKDIRKVGEIVYDNTMYEAGIRLAHAWRQRVETERARPPQDKRGGVWEFQDETTTQREVTAIVNFTNHLQITARFDSITRPNGDHKKVVTQITDFKTGNPKSLDPKVKVRQEQMMLFIAELFTAEYFKGNYNLTAPQRGFIFKRNHESKAAYGRSHFGYDLYEPVTGKRIFEPVEIADRAEFVEWFTQFGNAIFPRRSEVRRLLGRKSKKSK